MLVYNEYTQKKNFNFITKLLFFSGFIFFLSEILGGAIRYYFYNFGLTFLIYLPKILLIIVLLVSFFEKFFRLKFPKVLLLLFLIIIFSLVTAFFNIKNFSQIIYGLWLLIPFIYGIFISSEFFYHFERFKKYIFFLWIIAIMGVLLNIFYQWPWIGFDYNIGKFSIEGSREWATGGLLRIAGFSRISAAAASQILLTGILLVLAFKNLIFITLIWFITGITILLTTTKTTLVIWMVLTLLFIYSKIFGLKLIKFLPFVLTLIFVIFPFSTIFIEYSLNIHDFYSYFLLSSFEARLTYTWPWTINMLTSYGSLIFGRGVGGIGATQKLFEPNLYSPADNLALYFFGLFGIIGLIMLIWVGLFVSFKVGKIRYNKLAFFLAIACFSDGLTLSVMEESFFAACLGIIFSYAFSVVRKKRYVINY